MISGGLDRKVIMWSPYSRRSIGTLNGHAAPVVSLQMDEVANQLLTMSSDNVVKLWDLRNQRWVIDTFFVFFVNNHY
jgi:WD40 repeat protein